MIDLGNIIALNRWVGSEGPNGRYFGTVNGPGHLEAHIKNRDHAVTRFWRKLKADKETGNESK